MSDEWGVRFEDWGQPHTNWRHLDWPCGPHKFFWSSLTANQLITTCASLHTAASSHCQLFYSETGQYGRIVHLEEYRQPSPPVRDGLPILLPRALSQGSTQPVHLSFCSLCQPPRESERIGKKEIPWSPQSSSAPFILLPNTYCRPNPGVVAAPDKLASRSHIRVLAIGPVRDQYSCQSVVIAN